MTAITLMISSPLKLAVLMGHTLAGGQHTVRALIPLPRACYQVVQGMTRRI
jgi:hypothetical protein